MGDAAQGEPPKHEVFSTPFKVEPVYESWDTPRNYRQYPGGDKLPDKLKVWRVQKTDKTYGGVVSFSYGFEDSPDAEILTPGFNTGKESGAAGVGRHGNFLQWGFAAPPSQMTEAGKRFFLNCICYIHKFDGKGTLVRMKSSDRLNAVRMALLVNLIKDPRWKSNAFPAEVTAKYTEPKELAKYYEDRLELVYRDRVFQVDEDLAVLGLKSNRKVESLQRMIESLEDGQKAPAARRLLKRYTEQAFENPEEWRAWLGKNRERIYFTDVGGYKFLVIPEGYPAAVRH